MIRITIIIIILLFITSFKTQERPNITFEHAQELQEIKDNLELATDNLKTLDSINHKK